MRPRTTAALAAVLAIGSPALGQAVQWKASEGGNGHWYLGVPGMFRWTEAKPLAEGGGGYLVTLTNQAEADWVWDHVAVDPNLWMHEGIFWIGPWSGAHKVNGSWIYDTGESFWAPWCGGEPNGGYMEFYAHYYGGYNGPTPLPCWNDNQDQVGSIGGTGYIIEWSADCNNDGIVDYGQILSGELADANGNGVPDCCEGGPPCGSIPSDCNGNGIDDTLDLATGLLADCNQDGVPDDCTAGVQLLANGGFEDGPPLFCLNYSYGHELDSLPGWNVSGPGLPIDYQRQDGTCDPCWGSLPPEGNAFVDLIGSPGQGTIWQAVATVPGQRYRLRFALGMNCGDSWPAERRTRVTYGPFVEQIDLVCPGYGCDYGYIWPGYVEREFVATSTSSTIQFEALDYGGWGPLVDDIRLVRLPGDCPCTGDFNGDHAVGGTDLAILLAYWGPVVPSTPSYVDLNGDHAVDGMDLAILLAAWGVCR